MSGCLSGLSVWEALQQRGKREIYPFYQLDWAFVTARHKFSAWGRIPVPLLFIRRKSSELSESKGVNYVAQKPEIQTVVCPDTKTTVLCGHPAHKAGAAVLPASLWAIVSREGLRSSGQKQRRPLLWADFPRLGHSRKAGGTRAQETRIAELLPCILLFRVRCGERCRVGQNGVAVDCRELRGELFTH